MADGAVPKGCAEGCVPARVRVRRCGPTVQHLPPVPVKKIAFFLASGRDESLAPERIFIFFILFDIFNKKDQKISPELKWLFEKTFQTRGMLSFLKILGFVKNGQK